ncbi:STAS domain-containing protein [Luteipulveratus sp. YIM 133132]|uniref:Anti-sigma factor antagonist n=1 Tax=Luteipulveratus flavus TaxID=3031728 RepID=A0ABT6C445_9MICO|nr:MULTISPECIES: STAS domain-containing protein [unclassified Luteipulveratus]MDE9367797.1 STAS domain-containing protein [Luteipulveratus sp. YIM 133132]MDF8263719.1 STAS domain-containing protein [Luteipulveratus sp. YIM 133296]
MSDAHLTGATTTSAEGPTVVIGSVNDHTVVSVRGEVDMATAPDLQQALTQVTAEPGFRVVVDFTGTTFIDSSGIGALIGVHRSVAAGSGRLRLVVPPSPVRKVFELTRLTEVFEISDDVTTATRD